MFKKQRALKIAIVVLGIIAVIDLIRGYMHTYNIWYASENIAHMSQTADTMMLMHSFGISNYLTGLVYILILLKARELSPYILMLIVISYALGVISLSVTGVSAMQTSDWNGQYMMYIYLSVCLITSLNYFISAIREKRKA